MEVRDRQHRGGASVDAGATQVGIFSKQSEYFQVCVIRKLGFYADGSPPDDLELGRPGIWLRMDLEKPPSTQMSCPVT